MVVAFCASPVKTFLAAGQGSPGDSGTLAPSFGESRATAPSAFRRGGDSKRDGVGLLPPM